MNTRLAALTALLCAGAIPASHAAPGDQLSDCIQLSPAHQAARSGSQYLIIRSEDTHYRLGFGGACDAIALSSNVAISTDGKSNRLCPTGTQVSSKRDDCSVRSVEEITAREFERYVKRSMR